MFAELARQAKGVALAEVVSAVPLTDADRQLVASWLEHHIGGSVEIHDRVDPEIIGGILARVGDRLIDSSVRGRLEALRRQLEGGGGTYGRSFV